MTGENGVTKLGKMGIRKLTFLSLFLLKALISAWKSIGAMGAGLGADPSPEGMTIWVGGGGGGGGGGAGGGGAPPPDTAAPIGRAGGGGGGATLGCDGNEVGTGGGGTAGFWGKARGIGTGAAGAARCVLKLVVGGAGAGRLGLVLFWCSIAFVN